MLQIFQKFIWENITDIFTFPFWWYGRGLKEIASRIGHLMRRANQSLGVTLWIVNIFTPMFGQTDWQGRIISFFMRVAQTLIRSAAFVVFSVILLIFFAVWIFSLPLAVYLLISSIF